MSLTNITFTVRDTGDVVVPGVGCTAVDANTFRCTAFGQPVKIDTGDLADVVNAPLPLPTTVQAGAGDDTVTTGTAADSLQGALGNDRLTGGAGADRLDGNVGRDTLSGQEGRDTLLGGGRADEADVLSGGPDTDLADYSGRDLAFTVSLDDVAKDGEPGEDDNVGSDVEDITGGSGADQLTGSSAANQFFGGGGDDTLDGGVGPDVLAGGASFDRVTYKTRTNTIIANIDGVGNDGVTGEKDNITSDVESIEGCLDDDLLGGADFDRADNLVGGPGDDVLLGFEGDDDLFGNGGSDGLNCGPGGGDVGNGGAGNDRSNGCESTIGVEDVTP